MIKNDILIDAYSRLYNAIVFGPMALSEYWVSIKALILTVACASLLLLEQHMNKGVILPASAVTIIGFTALFAKYVLPQRVLMSGTSNIEISTSASFEVHTPTTPLSQSNE